MLLKCRISSRFKNVEGKQIKSVSIAYDDLGLYP